MKNSKVVPHSPFGIMKKMRYFNNLVVFFLMFCGIFVIYKYVKSLENELKQLSTKVQDLHDIQSQDVCSLQQPSFNVETNNMVSELTNEIILKNGEDDEEEDDESVQSQEIYDMIEDFADDEGKKNENKEDQEEEQENQDQDQEEEIHEPDSQNQREVIQDDDDDDDITIIEKNNEDVLDPSTLTAEELAKTKNDVLKKILKKQGKSVKGSKTDLINRILQK